MQNLPEWLSKKKKEIIATYGNGVQFALVFNPDLQKKCAQNIERSMLGDSPTVRQLNATYSEKAIELWLVAHLENLNLFTGVKEKMDVEQMKMVADVITTNYTHLKASEILLFFHKFKSGDFGKLYGSVDPMQITNAMIEFSKWRSAKLNKIQEQKKQEEMERKRRERLANSITYEEYLKRKELNLVQKSMNQEQFNEINR